MPEPKSTETEPTSMETDPTSTEKNFVLYADAKLNLALAVSPQIKDGRHLLESVYTTIDLSDRIDFNYDSQAEPSLRIETSYAPGLPTIDIPTHENLVYRAIRAFQNRFQTKLPGSLHIHLHKAIPSEAGLGGGSADAAGALIAMPHLVGFRPQPGELRDLAATLGSDVAFFLEGGCAHMGGWGEVLLSKLELPELDVVIAKPSAGLSTKAVYQRFDQNPQPAADLAPLVGRLGDTANPITAAELVPYLANNLSAAAAELCPETAVLTQELQVCPGLLRALLAGSGSAVFGLAADTAAAHTAAEAMRQKGYWAYATQTLPI